MHVSLRRGWAELIGRPSDGHWARVEGPDAQGNLFRAVSAPFLFSEDPPIPRFLQWLALVKSLPGSVPQNQNPEKS
jgi:hypothetical protein